MNKRLLLASLLICASHLPAQIEDTGPETKAKCNEYMKTPLPAEASAVAAPNSWPGCDSYKSYLGIGRDVDFAAARQCAWSERLAIQAGIEPRFSTASVFGGSAMLAVLYANGRGASRNIPLALRFACEAGGAPAEIEGRVAHLESARESQKLSDGRFNFCDDITSGFMEGFCAGLQSEMADQKRANERSKLISSWPMSQRDAFAVADRAEEAYAQAHARGEIDLSGTARAMFQIDAEQSLRDDFLAAVESFEKGSLPVEQAAAEADERLNTTYRKTMSEADKHKTEYGAVQPDGIRGAERAWLRYRDAWLAFAKQHYPAVSAEAWLTLLSNDRTTVLDGSFCDMDAEDGPCAQKGDAWKPFPLP